MAKPVTPRGEPATKEPLSQETEVKSQKQKAHPDFDTTASIISTPSWSYLRLKPLPSTVPTAMDPTSLRLSLLNSLSMHLGDHGAAISIDILSIDDGGDVPVSERCAIVRVPHDDALAVSSAVAASGNLRVERRADWLDGITTPLPKGLFEFARK